MPPAPAHCHKRMALRFSGSVEMLAEDALQ